MDKIRVAIADDNKLMADVLEEIIQQDQDMEIVGKASDGEEAYQLIRSKHPDVMLLDIIMPKLDGLSVMDKVHNDNDLTKRPAFIVVTAIGQEKVTENAFAMGADYYIMKPFDGEMIRRRIKQRRRPEALRSVRRRKRPGRVT